MCYINDTLFLRGTQSPKSFWRKTFWRDAPGMSVYDCATVHLNFQNSTENANAFVCSDPAFVRLQKSRVQNLSNIIGTLKFVNLNRDATDYKINGNNLPDINIIIFK